jgi:hypothetical protein
MDYVFFYVPDDGADDLSERILGVLASTSEGNPLGFETPVETSLMQGLTFLESRHVPYPADSSLGLVRLYQAEDKYGTRILIAGDKLSACLPGVIEVLRSGGIGNPKNPADFSLPGNDSWSLLGIAFPGWILLFDPDGVSIEKSLLEGNVTVLTVPSPAGSPIELLSPSENTAAAMGYLIRHILPLLEPGTSLSEDENGK